MDELPTTTAAIAKQRRGPLDAAWVATNPRISSVSSWRDGTWKLDHDLPGKPFVYVSFGNIPPIFAETCRRLVWTSLSDCRGTAEIGVVTVVVHRSTYLPYVLNGLPKHVTTLSGITREVFERFERNLRKDIDDGHFDRERPDEDGEIGPSLSAVSGVLSAWTMILEQSRSLADAGLDAVAPGVIAPVKARSMATAMTGDHMRSTPALPPQVAQLVMTAAERLTRGPAQDVILAVARIPAIRAALRAGVPGSEAVPEIEWSAGADGGPWRTSRAATAGSFRTYLIEARNAFGLVVGGLLTLQFGLAARRFSEVLSTPAGRDAESGLPSCIEVRRSGVFDLYYVKGILSKNQPSPRPETWLIGSRLARDGGVAEEDSPLGVVAMDLLERLYAPFRDLSDDPAVRASLLVAFNGFPTRGTCVRLVKHGAARVMMKAFLENGMVDWPRLADTAPDGTDQSRYKTSRGGCIQVAQWRKTLATFMMNIDPRLMLPLSRHLKHLTDATTEDEYVSHDPAFLEDMRDAAAQETGRLLYEIVRGERAAVGRMADRIREHAPQVEERIAGLDRRDAIAALKHWSLDRGISMFVLGPGKCFMPLMPTSALCHRVARTSSWTNRRPDSENRTDTLCDVCECHLKDAEHGDYWTRRYVEDRTVWLRAQRGGWAREYHVALHRSEYAALQLHRLSLPIPADEDLL